MFNQLGCFSSLGLRSSSKDSSAQNSTRQSRDRLGVLQRIYAPLCLEPEAKRKTEKKKHGEQKGPTQKSPLHMVDIRRNASHFFLNVSTIFFVVLYAPPPLFWGKGRTFSFLVEDTWVLVIPQGTTFHNVSLGAPEIQKWGFCVLRLDTSFNPPTKTNVWQSTDKSLQNARLLVGGARIIFCNFTYRWFGDFF